MNKGVLNILLVSFVLPLTGCSDSSYSIGEEGVLREGFTALADNNPKYEPKENKITIGDKTLTMKDSFKTYHLSDFAIFNYLDTPNNISLPVTGSIATFTPIFFIESSVDHHFVGWGFIETSEVSTEHHEVRSHR